VQERRSSRHPPHGVAGGVTVDAEERGTHFLRQRPTFLQNRARTPTK
jgi:hypothetical protein